MNPLNRIGDVPTWQFALRVALVAGQLILAFLFGTGGSPFFYQGF